MKPTKSTTPTDISIRPRNRQYDLGESLSKDWFDNEPFITAFFNSMSMTFPLGEKFFIDTVRAFADKIDDPKLQKEIRGFCGQEGLHRREHQRYNETLCEARGYDLDKLETSIKQRIAYGWKHFSALELLAKTTAAEHITAIFADTLLRHKQLLAGADPDMQALWVWHCSEEIEHKGVAFDVYTAMEGTRKQRILAMLEVTITLSKDVLFGAVHMLKRNGELWNFKVWKRGLSYLFGKQGLLRLMWPSYKEFYRRDFQPWGHDNREILATQQETLQAAA